MCSHKFSVFGLGTLATALALWSALPAAAQHGGGRGGGHGGGFHGGGFHGGGFHGGGFHGGGFHHGFHNGGFHHGFHNGGFHHGFHHGFGFVGLGGFYPWWSAYGWGYPYAGYSYPSYSYPSYSYPSYNYENYYVAPYLPDYGTYPYTSYRNPAVTYASPGMSASSTAPSAYEGAEEASSPATAASDAAVVNVRVPVANAQIWIQGQKTQQQGTVRHFVSPPLEPNLDYTYQVRAQWQENGQPVTVSKSVPVRAGDRVTVSFRTPPAQPSANTGSNNPSSTSGGQAQPTNPSGNGPAVP
jgi:uncharacterized protein (TIGR03000 family)